MTLDLLDALRHRGNTSLNQAFNLLSLGPITFIKAVEELRSAGVFEYCGNPSIDDSPAPFAATQYRLRV